MVKSSPTALPERSTGHGGGRLAVADWRTDSMSGTATRWPESYALHVQHRIQHSQNPPEISQHSESSEPKSKALNGISCILAIAVSM